ncbi:MAG: hypothetical protein AVDCRST_MAG45-2127, partial [uncultured Solirubrobacterales bacterium]
EAPGRGPAGGGGGAGGARASARERPRGLLSADERRRHRGRGHVPGLQDAPRARPGGSPGRPRARLHPRAGRAVPLEGCDQGRAGRRVRRRGPRRPRDRGLRPGGLPRPRHRPGRCARGVRTGRRALAAVGARARGGRVVRCGGRVRFSGQSAGSERRGECSPDSRSRALRPL